VSVPFGHLAWSNLSQGYSCIPRAAVSRPANCRPCWTWLCTRMIATQPQLMQEIQDPSGSSYTEHWVCQMLMIDVTGRNMCWNMPLCLLCLITQLHCNLCSDSGSDVSNGSLCIAWCDCDISISHQSLEVHGSFGRRGRSMRRATLLPVDIDDERERVSECLKTYETYLGLMTDVMA